MKIRYIVMTIALFTLGFPNISVGEDIVQAQRHYLATRIDAEQSIYTIKNDLIHPADLEKQLGQAAYVRPDNLPRTYRSTAGHFLIHYTLTGGDAVDPTATISDSVPDFVFETGQIAERAYRLLIDTLGFQRPPIDDPTNPETDIYIVNWNGSAYAYTYNENLVTSTPNQDDDYTAYTVIDNDYKEYSTTGIGGLKVTVAHEYFHVVQLGYNWWQSNGLPGSSDDQYFLEWCSTWFEERAYPEVNDYFNYLGVFFYSPSKSLWNFDYAYALGPFLKYILDSQGEELLVKIWDRIKSTCAFESLQGVLRDERGVELAGLWNDFYYKCYFTGNRYRADLALSSDAQFFPPLIIPAANEAVLGLNTKFQTPISPFATAPYQVTFDRRQYVGLNAADSATNDFIGQYLLVKHDIGQIAATISFNENLLVGDAHHGDSLLVFITNSSKTNSRNLTLEVAEVSDSFQITTKVQALYPNPYQPGRNANLTVKLQIGQIVKSIETTMFDLRGRCVYRQNFGDGLINLGPYSLTFNSADLWNAQLSSGVYLLQIEVGSETFVRKLLLLK